MRGQRGKVAAERGHGREKAHEAAEAAGGVVVTSNRDDTPEGQLETFLSKLGLERYYHTLVKEAVLSLDDLKLIEHVGELEALGVESSFHQKKLLRAIKEEL